MAGRPSGRRMAGQPFAPHTRLASRARASALLQSSITNTLRASTPRGWAVRPHSGTGPAVRPPSRPMAILAQRALVCAPLSSCPVCACAEQPTGTAQSSIAAFAWPVARGDARAVTRCNVETYKHADADDVAQGFAPHLGAFVPYRARAHAHAQRTRGARTRVPPLLLLPQRQCAQEQRASVSCYALKCTFASNREDGLADHFLRPRRCAAHRGCACLAIAGAPLAERLTRCRCGGAVGSEWP